MGVNLLVGVFTVALVLIWMRQVAEDYPLDASGFLAAATAIALAIAGLLAVGLVQW